MRLIDADVLKEELSSLSVTITGLRSGKGVLSEFMEEYRKSILRIIDEQATIDPESLRSQGEWVWKHPNGWACSNCGEWGLMIDNRGIAKSNYCPNCGARMKT